MQLRNLGNDWRNVVSDMFFHVGSAVSEHREASQQIFPQCQEVSLLGPNWQNSLRLPVSDLGSRVQPQEYTMDGEKPLNVD